MTTYQNKVRKNTWMVWVLLSAGLIATIYASVSVVIDIDADAKRERRKLITRCLLACVIKPFVTVDWWERTLDLLGELSNEAPCYTANGRNLALFEPCIMNQGRYYAR